jgi:glutaredoxin
MSDEAGRVVLYVRARCHLCDSARQVVEPLAEAAGTTVREIDIDTAPDSADLVDRYGELIPVVVVDGVQQGYWRIDGSRVRRALEAAPA